MKDGTRARVLDAARALGFEPNLLARSLRTRSSKLIGIVVPDVGITFYARALKGAQGVLEQAGYQALVMSSERDPSREAGALRTLLAHQVDGMLVATSGGADGEIRVPLVYFDQIVPGAGEGTVALANAEGVGLLVEHLRGHGHERIAFVGGPLRPGARGSRSGSSAAERLQGYRTALRRAGLPSRPEYVRLGDDLWSSASGEAAARALLGLDEPPTAIVAAGDTLAVGVRAELRRARVRVPGRVALVSFDDPALGELLDPPMTALTRHDRELGELAASMLLARLRGENGAAREVRVPLALIVRGSCGCR